MKQFWKDTILASIITILLVLLLNIPSHAKVYKYISGTPRIIDGDTIEINKEKIRFACVDTPESNYKGKTQYCLDNETDCGFLAKQALVHMVGADQVTCFYEKRDVYGRILGFCTNKNWENDYSYDLSYNYGLIELGYAWYYAGGKDCNPFKTAFEKAQTDKVGLFDDELGGFKEPKLWRKTKSND